MNIKGILVVALVALVAVAVAMRVNALRGIVFGQPSS